MSDKQAPVQKFRIGKVTASIWANDAANGSFYAVTVTSVYKDKDNNIGNSHNFAHGELLNAIKVLERAERWIAQQQLN